MLPKDASAELVVVGLGAVGSAVVYQAAKAGVRVTGIDRFHPPHDRGSSHGETRIMRQAIGEGHEFVPLALRSNEIWEELQSKTGRDLLTRNGALIIAPLEMAGSHHGSRSFLQDTIDTALRFGIRHEVLRDEQLRQRFPQFRVEAAESGYYEPGAGFLRPEACVEVQIDLARKMGAGIHTGEMVTSVKPQVDGVEVVTDRNTYHAEKVILTAGPWMGGLLGQSLKRYFKVYRQVLYWFELAGNHRLYLPECFPVFIWLTGAGAHDMMYGFPAVDGISAGVKVATERYDAIVDPDEVSRDVAREEAPEMYRCYVADRLPDVSPKCLRSATCLYTVVPDARFVIDYAFDSTRVLFASACSGHGFKHSAALGEALVDVTLGRPCRIDLSPFSLGRFAKEDPILHEDGVGKTV